nr:hypothetical protein Iba_chr10bCG12570 [Ipomoea batatas]
MRNILRGSLCGGGSGRGRGGEDPLVNQKDPPPGNTSLEVPGGSSDQQDEPLGNPSTEVSGGGDPPASPTFLLVFPFRLSSGQPPSRPTFVVFSVFRQVEPSSIRLPVRPQVRFSSDCHGRTPLSPHRVATHIPGSSDVQGEDSQVEDEEARQVEEAVQVEVARRVEETTDPPVPVEEQALLPEDPPLGNTSLEVPGGSSDQQDEPLGNPSTEVRGGGDPLASPTFLLVFPLRLSSGQTPSRPTFVVFPIFRQVEPSSIRLLVRQQVRFPSDSHGHAPLSPRRVAIDIPASADVPGGSSDQQDEPLGNPSTEVSGGGDPLSSPTFLLVFPFRPSSGQPPSRPTFVVFPVFRQVEPSSIRLPVRPQVRFPSDCHGRAPLSPHRVAIHIPASSYVQEEDSQVEVEEARQVEEAVLVEVARRVEEAGQQEAADPLVLVEEQAQLPVPLRPVNPDFSRFPGIPGQQQLRDQESLVATIEYYKNWIRFWNQIVQSLLSLLQYAASFRGVGDECASTNGVGNATNIPFENLTHKISRTDPHFTQKILIMRNILRGTLCGGSSGRGRGGEDPLANQEDPPQGNTLLEVPGGISDQQDEPLGNPSTEVCGGGNPPASPTFLLVFPLRPSSGQPPSRPTFVVFPVFRQVEPSSIRLPVRLQVRFPSDSHGHAPLSPHRVTIDIPASADVQEEASQEDPPQGNTLLEVPGGISDQQDEPLGNPSTEVRGGGNPPASHTFLLVFPLCPSSGQPPSRPTFVVFPVFRQVEPSSIRLLVRPQVRFPSDSHGHAPLSPHRVAIDIPASADVQEEASQVSRNSRPTVVTGLRIFGCYYPILWHQIVQSLVTLLQYVASFRRVGEEGAIFAVAAVAVAVAAKKPLANQEDPPPGNTSLEVPSGSSDQQGEPLGNPSTEVRVRLQVWFPSDSHGHAPLSPHRVAIDIAASADVQEDASQVEVEEARLVEEAADTPAL